MTGRALLLTIVGILGAASLARAQGPFCIRDYLASVINVQQPSSSYQRLLEVQLTEARSLVDRPVSDYFKAGNPSKRVKGELRLLRQDAQLVTDAAISALQAESMTRALSKDEHLVLERLRAFSQHADPEWFNGIFLRRVKDAKGAPWTVGQLMDDLFNHFLAKQGITGPVEKPGLSVLLRDKYRDWTSERRRRATKAFVLDRAKKTFTANVLRAIPFGVGYLFYTRYVNKDEREAEQIWKEASPQILGATRELHDLNAQVQAAALLPAAPSADQHKLEIFGKYANLQARVSSIFKNRSMVSLDKSLRKQFETVEAEVVKKYQLAKAAWIMNNKRASKLVEFAKAYAEARVFYTLFQTESRERALSDQILQDDGARLLNAKAPLLENLYLSGQRAEVELRALTATLNHTYGL